MRVDATASRQGIIPSPLMASSGANCARCRQAAVLPRLNGKQVRVVRFCTTPCLCCPRNGKRVRACQEATGRQPGKATRQDSRARIPAFAQESTEVPRGSGHGTLGARVCSLVHFHVLDSPTCGDAGRQWEEIHHASKPTADGLRRRDNERNRRCLIPDSAVRRGSAT